MQIIIEDNKTIRLAQLFDHEEKAIVKRFSVKDPQAHRKKAMMNGWGDGYFYYYNKSKQTLKKGYLKPLLELCLEENIPFDLVDTRPKSKFPVPAVGSFDNQLIDEIVAHKHQLRCWNSVCMASKHILFEIGTHFHPTGAGKSAMMAGIVKLLRCPTVIITEQTIVLNQIVKSLKIFNVVHHDDIGEFYSGKMPDGNLVCVGSIAAVRTPKKPTFKKFNVRIDTVKKDFKKMFSKDLDKLKSILTVKQIMAWRRSDVMEAIKNSPDEFEELLPPGFKGWINKTSDEVYNTICEMYVKDSSRLKDILGSDFYKVWSETTPIDSDYDHHLTMAVQRFYTYEKDYYFKIAIKAYHTLLEKSRALKEMVGCCELLMIDEMDNAASDNYSELFDDWFNGRYVHGFSGTPYDPDKPVQKMILEGRFGPVISKSSRRELEDIGQIQPVKYFMFQFGDHNPQDKTMFDVAEREIIIDNEKFHLFVLNIVNTWPNDKNLIVVDTSNIEDVGKKLQDLIPSSVFIYNKVSNKKRKEAIESFENGKIRTLIVSKIGKRGMDLGGGSHNLILIGGGRLYSNFNQIIGRGVRKNDIGYTRVFDFYFTGNKYLLTHSRSRLKFIVEMGYNATVIYKGITIPADKFIRSRYRLPR